MSPFRVLLLPGSVLPAEPAYGALMAALGSDVDVVAKELEVYATVEPPADYSLELEVDGVLRAADARGWERFHLAGYSGGGAPALAFTARYPDRLSSLALLEPAWAGNWDLSPAEQALWREYRRLEGLPPDQFCRPSCGSGSSRVSRPRRRLRVRRPPGWRSVQPASGRFCGRSGRTSSTARPCGASTGRSTSRWVG
jgi:pimeloyl-ACP methyl ester carboxylesterase